MHRLDVDFIEGLHEAGPWVPVAWVYRLVGVSRVSVHKAVKEGRLPVAERGHMRACLVEDVEAAFERERM